MPEPTDIEAADDRLRGERGLSQLIIESATEGIIVVDKDLRYLVWNPAMEGINGARRGEVIGRTVFEVTPGFADHPVGRAWREAVAGRRAELRDFRFFSLPRRAEVVYDADFTPLYDPEGAIIGAVCLLRETTDRHRVEAMMRQSQKLEAVAQLTGGVAHDFNNLLTAVVGCLDMILLQSKDAAIAGLAETALRSANRGTRLIQQLLAFASRQSLRPVVADLGSLLAEIEVLLRRAAGDSIAIAVDAPPSLWRCRVDPAQFEAAAMNLVINARDAMPRGGRVSLRARNVLAGSLPDGAELRPGDYVAFEVADTGEGMAPDIVGRAFEPFFTTKEIGKGSGLGLSMVYGFARQSGGGVALDSSPGAGTRVTLYLPRAVEDGTGDADIAATEPRRGSGAVLVVEDDEEVREVSVAMLQSLGYRVFVARDGPEALQVLQRLPSVDLLFTDLIMPNGMSGTALAREAERARPGLKVLLTTGYAGAGAAEGDGYPLIAKPFYRSELSRVVAELLGGRGAVR
ncbi:MAG TPA: PAS domain-containing protein [Stellaceae bacterium]|nr:PAS domain-containing protein [Stellaceae bacterium]